MRTARQRRLLLRLFCITIWTAVQVNLSFAVNSDEIDGPNNRKLLGSSVVTSVSVIMDHPNGTKTYITDGEPEVPPTVVGSPAALMSPDRYEFYSFGKDGELVKKLMTLDQIQGLIAGGDELNHEVDGYPANFYQQPLVQAGEPEGVNKVLERVQNVLKSEMETAHVPDHLEVPPMPDDSWSILFPGLFNGDFDFKESTKPTVRPTPASKKPAPPPFPSTTPTRPLMSSTLQAVRVTTPRQPITSSSKSPERPSQQTTARQPPQSLGTTTKYSAHYSTPPPNLKLQNKPVTVVKKPTGSQPKPQQPVKNTMPRPTTNGTASASFFRPVNTSVAGAKNNATTAPSLKVPNATVINTTSKPTTMKGTTEKMKPSGIPTITHYLPVQTSIGPSEAVKTVKPAIPTKPTIKTTPRPVTKPMNTKPYLKTNITMVQPTNKPITLPSTTTKSQPVAEKLVQKQPANPVLQGSSSEIVRVSVSTPSGPPSTLKMTALTTAKPLTSPTSRPNNSSTVRPVTTPPKPVKPLAPIKAPQVSVQPNRTSVTTPRPATSQKREPVNTKPRPTPAVSTSSVATHKPVLVMTSKPLVKTPVNSNVTVVFTTRAPTGTTKYVPPATATQSRLSTTAMPMKTTITTTSTTTRPPITTTGATTQADATVTLSNELDQVPLKLAASLKEPQQNVFEQVPLMSTTLKEVPTMITSGITTESTTTKWEHNTNVNSAEQTTINSATSTSFPPEASTMTAAPSTVMTEVPTTLSKVYIINNSEPQKIQLPIKAGQKRPQDEPMASTVAEWVNSRPEAQTTESLSPTSTSSDAPTTVTEAQSTTTFKDQVMEDGINAVASILLDDKVAVDKSTLAERLAMPASQPETLQTTEITTATQPETTANDLPAFREEPDIRTSTRRNEDSGRTTTTKAEKTTWTTPPPTIVTSAPTIVTTEIEITTTPSPTTTNSNAKTTSEQKRIQTPALASPTTTVAPITTVASTTAATSKMPTNATTAATAFKKEELRKPQPVKESKLNPDSDEQPQESQVTSVVHQMSTEGTTIIMEQVKLTEKVPVTHAPPPMPAPTVKVPLQEPKLPSPALKRPSYSNEVTPPPGIDLHPAPYESMGAEASTAFLAEDVRRFADLCNELAFRLWTATTSKGQISSRSLVMSPFAAISLLAMVFLGARGATSGQMNEILRLDDMVTFNPHQVLQNVTDSVINSRNLGVATAAFVRQLYSDKSKGKILDFYKERAQQYYGGHVEEVSFATVGDVVRRRTNLLVKRQTLGKVPEYLRGSSLNLRPPLAAFSANIFQTDCESGSTEGRDGEMYFVVRPSTRQRRLVPVPAVVWRSGFSAGYEPSLDATSVCLGQDSIVSTLLILPGQQGQVAPGDGLARLEQRLIETSYRRGGWSRLLRSLLIRPGLELQVPRFSHRSVLNVTSALARMGLRDLFSFKADLRGLNGGVTELHLSDMVQVNTFSTCGEEVLGARHHIETYPASPQRTGREEAPLPNYLDDEPHYEPRRPRYHFNGDDFNDGRPRTGRLPMAAPSSDPAPPRLRFDRPFLYIVRHNPSGIILHIGRFNPRLLP